MFLITVLIFSFYSIIVFNFITILHGSFSLGRIWCGMFPRGIRCRMFPREHTVLCNLLLWLGHYIYPGKHSWLFRWYSKGKNIWFLVKNVMRSNILAFKWYNWWKFIFIFQQQQFMKAFIWNQCECVWVCCLWKLVNISTLSQISSLYVSSNCYIR